MATILIVEDDRITAFRLQRRLTRLGHTVLTPVASAAEALAAVQAHRPEVVFMDVGLRGEVDGLETGRTIEATAAIPVIYLSGYTLAQLTARNGGTAPRFYLTKPLAAEVLVRTLTRALDDAARQRTPRAWPPTSGRRPSGVSAARVGPRHH
jgi:two-component system, response regulator PdtaR